jgi:hypothetical protein
MIAPLKHQTGQQSIPLVLLVLFHVVTTWANAGTVLLTCSDDSRRLACDSDAMCPACARQAVSSVVDSPSSERAGATSCTSTDSWPRLNQ